MAPDRTQPSTATNDLLVRLTQLREASSTLRTSLTLRDGQKTRLDRNLQLEIDDVEKRIRTAADELLA